MSAASENGWCCVYIDVNTQLQAFTLDFLQGAAVPDKAPGCVIDELAESKPWPIVEMPQNREHADAGPYIYFLN